PVSRVLSGRSQDDGGLRLGQVRGELFQRLTAIYTDAGPHEPVAGRVGDTWLGSGGTFEPGFLNHPRHSVAELAGRVAEVDHGMAYERFELGLTVEHLVVKIGGRDFGQVSVGNRVRADLNAGGVHVQKHLLCEVAGRVEEA